MSDEFKKEFVKYMTSCSEKDYLIYLLDKAKRDVVDLKALLCMSVLVNVVLFIVIYLK